jgi:hypothetical protein
MSEPGDRELSSERERLDQLRKAIGEGLASGPAEPWDPEEIKRLGRERLKTADKKPPGADDQ